MDARYEAKGSHDQEVDEIISSESCGDGVISSDSSDEEEFEEGVDKEDEEEVGKEDEEEVGKEGEEEVEGEVGK